MKNIILVLFLVTNHLGMSQNDLYSLKGRIAKEEAFFCQVYRDGKKQGKFQTRPKKIDYSGNIDNHFFGEIRWFGDDKFLAIEGIEIGHSGKVLSNLVVLNPKGEVIEKIIENKKNYYVGTPYPSKTESKILYETWTKKPPANSSSYTKEELKSLLNPQITLNVFDYKTKELEVSLDNFNKTGRLVFNESPWSPNEKMFVYTIQRNHSMKLEGEVVGQKDTTGGGSYIFDVEKKQDIRYLPDSYQAVWAPTSNVIAYLKNKHIWLYNFEENSHRIFLRSTDDLKISNIHWNTDGDYLYVQCIYKNKNEEKLYNVKDGKEVLFNKLGMTDPYYTWQ